MIISKNLKAALFKAAARFHFLNWLFLLIIAFGVVSWATTFLGSLESNLWLYILITAIGLLSFLAWILLWGWYSVWFRCLAYGAAKVISGIRGILSSTIIQLVIILGLSSWFWVWRKQVLQGGDLDLKDILRLTSMLKILVLAAALFTMWKLFQSRKRIVICDFVNFTGKDTLDPVVKGIASICSIEMGWLSKLLKTYDDIQPDAEKKMAKVDLNLDVQDIGKDFEQIIGEGSSLKIANINVPIGYLYSFFRKILHGPMLTGGVHLNGDKFTLTASLKGGKFKGNWQIGFEENETPPKDDSEKLIKLTERLVCRMLTDLSPEITPRWKAMHNFIEGLRLFRETLLTEEKRKLNLIKAKDTFSLAVRDDEQFVQCYYNFGYIYRQLGSEEAAKAAFREALKKKPDYHQCYYQLADIYYENYLNEMEKKEEEYSLFDAQWFCQQAVTICPSDPYYWDLLAVIRFYIWWEGEEGKGNKKNLYDYKSKLGIPDKVLNDSMVGAMLAWQALCKSIIKGEKAAKYKDTALICARNLAVLTGMNKQWRSRRLFGQAIFLDPDNNDLHFERGKYFYRRDKISFIKKANKAFNRVFEDDEEVNDSFSFWAIYMNVNAQLYKEETKTGKHKDREKEYLDVVKSCYINFLDAAAEIIHNKDEEYDIDYIKSNEKIVSEALELTNNNNKKAHQVCLLLELIKFLPKGEDTGCLYKWVKEACKKISQDKVEFPKDFFIWMGTQIAVNQALQIIKDEGNFFDAVSKLKGAINKLEKRYPNELKILGLYRYLATAYLFSDSYEKALELARKAARLSPYEPEVREVLGKVYYEMKDYNQAIKELQICFHIGKPTLDILNKIGDAYIKEGKVLRDPERRKESFKNATEFFKECHDIIEDKSYDPDAQDYELYIETLGKTHFNLAYFYRELLL